jgi:hypothetical protein
MVEHQVFGGGKKQPVGHKMQEFPNPNEFRVLSGKHFSR